MNVFELFAKVSLDTKGFKRGLSTVSKSATAVFGGASAAITAFTASSVKTGMDFDKSMSQVAATMGFTMEQMENEVGKTTVKMNGQVKEFDGTLREFAQFMGRNTAFTATQASDALNYMALAGYKTQESMEMLPNVLNLAAAGNMDLARASDMVTDTQTAFGITFERTSQMVDEMAKAASTGNTNVEQLGDAFLTIGGIAKELNGGFVTLADGTKKETDGIQELEIALTGMANAGIKGSEAGTHMRNMLLKLSSPTSAGTKQLEQLGVKVFDAEGNMRSLKDVFIDLNASLGKLTQEQRIKAISKLFNVRDMASATALLGAVNQDWNAIGESILNAEGAASKMAETQLDNLAGDVTLFKSALEGAQIAISDKLTPTLREFVQIGTAGIQEMTDKFESEGLSGASSAFGEMLSDFIVKIVEIAPQVATGAVEILKAFVQGLKKNFSKVSEAVTEIVITITEGVSEMLPELVDAGVKIIGEVIVGMGKALPKLIPATTKAMTKIGQSITDNLPLILESVLQTIVGTAEGIVKSIPILIRALPKVINSIIKFIIGAIPQFIEAAIQLVMGIIDAIPDIIAAIIEALPLIITGIIDALLDPENMEKMLLAGIDLFVAMVSSVPRIISGIIEKLPEIVDNIINGLKEQFESGDFAKAGKAMLEGLYRGLVQNIDEFTQAILELFGLPINEIKALYQIQSPSKKMAWFGKMIDQGLAIGINKNADAVLKSAQKVNEGLYDTFNQDYEIGMSSRMNSIATSRNASISAQNGYMGDSDAYEEEIIIPQGVADSTRDLTVILELDRMQLGRAVYRLNNEETQRVGVQLAGVNV